MATILFALSVAACGGKADTVPAEQHVEPETAEAGHGPVKLSAEQLEASGITLETVGAATIRESLPVYGVIAPNAERVRDVAARFPGVVREINGKIGDAVKKIRFATPATREGELEIRLDGCDGALVARMPLAPAVASPAVTVLPRAATAPVTGRAFVVSA